MVRRTEYAKFIYIAFALIVLMMNWDSNKTNAAVAASGIPQESIRVRILGNSDNLQDQAVKKIVRDRVVEEINGWVAEPHNLEMAREDIRAHLGELDEIVGQVLQEKGFGYGHKVELDTVPFPEKMYGGQLYPAGSYEALRITLGSGQGKNWWCVLFLLSASGMPSKKKTKPRPPRQPSRPLRRRR
ncbi:stage II sporulation protein R [Paenibacillus sp. CC-CFT747]|nr:stage II sporulation protein R [Paenibacillus sp. CC-CFT747]